MNIYEKLAAVQQATKAPKNQKNTHLKYNYRSAESILEAVKPVLQKYKATILLEDDLTVNDGWHYVESKAVFIDLEYDETALRHSLEVTAFAREEPEKKGMDASQITGTASSYARKYALNGLLLIDDTKDADTDEFHEQTEGKFIKVTHNTSEKAPETPENGLSESKKQVIRALAKEANIDLESIGEDLDTMTEKRANAMIVRLKERIGEKS